MYQNDRILSSDFSYTVFHRPLIGLLRNKLGPRDSKVPASTDSSSRRNQSSPIDGVHRRDDDNLLCSAEFGMGSDLYNQVSTGVNLCAVTWTEYLLFDTGL